MHRSNRYSFSLGHKVDELYTKFVTKLGVNNRLTLTVKVEYRPEGGISPQKAEELKAALRELGLTERFE